MKILLLTREYPPDVYGGAGVHVEYMARELAARAEVEVRCFGQDRATQPDGPQVRAYRPWDALKDAAPAVLPVLSVDLAMAADAGGASVVHSHTWYANFAGHLTKLLHGIPHVATTHSLEPLRPWKVDQLGVGGFEVSRFMERTALENADAVITVSTSMSEDLLRVYPAIDPARVHVIHNGIDAEEYRPDPSPDAVRALGVEPDRPSVVFVGRITSQKGVTYLLDAAHAIDPSAQLVLCAGAPDTVAIGREVRDKVERLQAERGNVIWIRDMLPKRSVIHLLTHATVFVCPSVYEPFGIVNLEAMACETAVVASATGGIPEAVADGETGTLVPFEAAPDGFPADPAAFAAGLAAAINALLDDPARARSMGLAGRRRVLERFSWAAIARRTLEVYADLTVAPVAR